MDNGQALENKNRALGRLEQPGIEGVGVGFKTVEGIVTDEVCVVFLVEEKKPLAALTHEEAIPPMIGNVGTDIVQSGKLYAPPAIASQVQDRTDRWRPAPGGVSIGHFRITAGTLGAIVKEPTTGLDLILTNNHVAADSNDGELLDEIFQPGPFDGGTPGDTIGHLYKFMEIDFGQGGGGDPCPLANGYERFGNFIAGALGSKRRVTIDRIDPQAINKMDAALVLPTSPDIVDRKILEIGTVNGWTDPVLGMKVKKSGRTTGLTEGIITMLHATVDVSYGGNKRARFEDQILTGAMSEGGDSGSLLVSNDTFSAVGLLFAGSSQVTIYNPIQEVLDAFNIEF